jgi:hypothetical protein
MLCLQGDVVDDELGQVATSLISGATAVDFHEKVHASRACG